MNVDTVLGVNFGAIDVMLKKLVTMHALVGLLLESPQPGSASVV